MPDPASPTPGDNAGVPTVTIVPASTVTAGGDDNAGLLADLEAELAGGGAPAKPTPAGKRSLAAAAPTPAATEPTEEPAVEPTEDDEPPAELPLEDEEEPEDETPADPDDDPAVAAAADKDPALKARLDAVRRTEERQRARLENRAQEIDRAQQQFVTERGAALQRIQQFDQLVARAKYDLPSVVRALGIEPSDFEYHAQSLMAHSPKFAADEKYRGAAEKAMREREASDRAEAAARKVAELETKLETRDQQAVAERELDTYFARTMRKATDATPITAALIKNGPKAARAALTATAYELAGKLGRLPNAAELLTAHERKEARALRLRGIKPGTPAAAAAVAATTAAPPAKPATPPAKPATNGAAKPNGKPTKAAPAATPADPHHIPSRDELLAGLAELSTDAAT